jgi:hypothetical protein
LLHAAEVAALSAAGPAATLMNQPELGITSCPGPLKLGGAVRTVVLVAAPPGPAVRLFSVNAGGTNIELKTMPVVGAGAPQTPGRIWAACTLPGASPDRLTVTVIEGVGEVPIPEPCRSALPRAAESATGLSSSRAVSGGLAPRATW